jgi:hypothetical protein
MFAIQYVKMEIKDDFPTGFGSLKDQNISSCSRQITEIMNCQLGIFSKDEFFRRVRNSPALHSVSITVNNQNCGLINYTCVLHITGTEFQVNNCFKYIKEMLY